MQGRDDCLHTSKVRDVITYPYQNFSGGLTYLILEFMYG